MLKALKARALSMELAHLWLNSLLIEMGWCWSLPDACSEQGRGDVLRNRRRRKATRMSGSDFCLRSLVFEMGRHRVLYEVQPHLFANES